jgi:hypothetical protein
MSPVRGPLDSLSLPLYVQLVREFLKMEIREVLCRTQCDFAVQTGLSAQDGALSIIGGMSPLLQLYAISDTDTA